MTSKERKERRYQRRKAKREERRNAAVGKYDDFENATSLDALYKASMITRQGVNWKASVKRFHVTRMKHIYWLHTKLVNGEDIRKGFIVFHVIERGKKRKIMSVHYTERVVQKAICRNALYPIFTRSLIYDNGASQRGKGTAFAIKRLTIHLQRHIHRHGRKGGILLIDFKDYFANVDHEALRKIYEKRIEDKRLRELAWLFVEAFGEKGLGLGSETSQINAITLRNEADHYAKEVLRIKGYAGYMDDTYLIHEDTGYLKECLEKLKVVYAESGIRVNDRKTRICDLKHGFTFLKTRFFITETGHIVKRPCRDSITRERRKLKKQAKLLNEWILAAGDIRTSYASWKGSLKGKDAYRTLQRMDALYNKLIIKEWRYQTNDQEDGKEGRTGDPGRYQCFQDFAGRNGLSGDQALRG